MPTGEARMLSGLEEWAAARTDTSPSFCFAAEDSEEFDRIVQGTRMAQEYADTRPPSMGEEEEEEDSSQLSEAATYRPRRSQFRTTKGNDTEDEGEELVELGEIQWRRELMRSKIFMVGASTPSPSRTSPSRVETPELQTARISRQQSGTAISPESRGVNESVGLGDGGEEGPSVWRYSWELVLAITDGDSVRGKQSRLTLWELLEHFDFVNDLYFICRVGWTIVHAHVSTYTLKIGYQAILCLVCIWLTSLLAYALRRWIIYHRIEGENLGLFVPFVVFRKIRQVGDTAPEALYMFERLFWTYQLVMRLVEDIPQVVVSAIFLANFGRDLYTYFMIAYSCMLMALTSYRMGVMYPLFGTLSLVLSREPPVDSPVLTEAATTTRNFAGFMSCTFCLWALTQLLCLHFARGVGFAVFCLLAIISTCLSLFFLSYWVYLHKEALTAETEGEVAERLMESQSATMVRRAVHSSPLSISTTSSQGGMLSLEQQMKYHEASSSFTSTV